jgi:ribosomal subunit interface protein
MDVVVKGRGERLEGATRTRVERKLARLERFDGRLDRIELEVIRETRGRIGGGHRVQASCRSGRRTYRASARGPDVEAAVDRLVERLERQITDKHRRRRTRAVAGRNGIQSGRIAPEEGMRPQIPPAEPE